MLSTKASANDRVNSLHRTKISISLACVDSSIVIALSNMLRICEICGRLVTNPLTFVAIRALIRCNNCGRVFLSYSSKASKTTKTQENRVARETVALNKSSKPGAAPFFLKSSSRDSISDGSLDFWKESCRRMLANIFAGVWTSRSLKPQ